MKITLPTSNSKILIFDDCETYNGRADLRDWYNVSIVDHEGNVTELCRVDKNSIKRLAKAS